jgi:hypothetical protein
MLVALAIATAFLSGVYATFIQVVKAQDKAAAREEALRNGRTAITSMSDELKQVNKLGSAVLFVGLNGTLTTGDGYDNDLDGRVDEELVDGLDNDNDFAVTSDDRHAQILTQRERPNGVGKADLGDAHVDEDCKFGRDSLIFRIYPTTPTSDLVQKTITYAVTTFDGQPDTLVRQTRIDRTGQEPLIGVSPIAFGVLGFDLLYWDPNATAANQYWVTTWNSAQSASFASPQLPLPASVYLRLTLYADSRPAQNYIAGQAVETITMDTVINLEATINDALFPRSQP